LLSPDAALISVSVKTDVVMVPDNGVDSSAIKSSASIPKLSPTLSSLPNLTVPKPPEIEIECSSVELPPVVPAVSLDASPSASISVTAVIVRPESVLFVKVNLISESLPNEVPSRVVSF